MTTKSKILKCVFTSEWKAPNGTIIYYHELTMENGDIGSIGKADKYPADIAEGREIEYSLETTAKGHKIKMERVQTTQQTSTTNPNPSRPAFVKSSSPKQVVITDYYGYIAGYTKDLVIAGKTSKKDITDFKRIMNEMVEHFEGLLEKNKSNTPV